MKPAMSPKRRFLTSMMGGVPDRTPVGNVVSTVTIEQMKASNTWFPDAHLYPEAMAELASGSHELLGYDTVTPVFSVIQEAAALGCEIDWGSPDTMPGVRSRPLPENEDLKLPEGWMEARSIQVVLEALHLLRRYLGERVVVVGKVMGPWTLSYHLIGVEDFLVSTIQDPKRAARSLHRLKEVSIAFARAQMQAGADIICLADHATGGMVSPIMYRDMLMPIHQEIVAEVGCPIVLHCCGDTTDRLAYFADTGIDCYHFESQVKVEDAIRATAGKITLIGNINNPQLLLTGTPEEVVRAGKNAIDGGVHILSPECAVPLQTPMGNLRALVMAVKEEK